MTRCPYCQRIIWKTAAYCPQCQSKLLVRKGRGPRLNNVLVAISILAGAPLGGLFGESLDRFVLFHRMGIVVEVIGAIAGVLLLYTFILLHTQRR
jgi:hypothetical protein